MNNTWSSQLIVMQKKTVITWTDMNAWTSDLQTHIEDGKMLEACPLLFSQKHTVASPSVDL